MTPLEALQHARRQGRVVIKIGSGVITDTRGRIDPKAFKRLGNDISGLTTARRWPFVVSSGAIAAGVGELKLGERPSTMAGLQAAAAIGQSKLVETWAQVFRRHDLQVAQILLTHHDLADRRSYLNAKAALMELARLRVVPIINENDSVSFEEIAFGDNDQLAAQVGNLVDASLVIMLSVAPGLLDENGERIPIIAADDPRIDAWIRPEGSRFGRGGMASKIQAARAATQRGTPVVILSGTKPDQLGLFFEGEDVGTVLLPSREDSMISSRDSWIRHTLKPHGQLILDAGAVKAIQEAKKSLLGRGILRVEGDFQEGESVQMLAEDGHLIACGLTRYRSDDVRRILGKSSSEIEAILGYSHGPAVVHRDDLVENA